LNKYKNEELIIRKTEMDLILDLPEIQYESRDIRLAYLLNLLILSLVLIITFLSLEGITFPVQEGLQGFLGRSHITLGLLHVIPWSMIAIFFITLSVIEIKEISKTRVSLRPNAVVINGEAIDLKRIKLVESHYAVARNIGLGKFIGLRYDNRRTRFAIKNPGAFLNDVKQRMERLGIHLENRIFYFHSGEERPWRIEILEELSGVKESTSGFMPSYLGEFLEVLLSYWIILGVCLLPVIFQKNELLESLEVILIFNPPVITLLAWRYLLSIEPKFRRKEGLVFGIFLLALTFFASIVLMFLSIKNGFAIFESYSGWLFYLEIIAFSTLMGYLRW